MFQLKCKAKSGVFGKDRISDKIFQVHGFFFVQIGQISIVI